MLVLVARTRCYDPMNAMRGSARVKERAGPGTRDGLGPSSARATSLAASVYGEPGQALRTEDERQHQRHPRGV